LVVSVKTAKAGGLSRLGDRTIVSSMINWIDLGELIGGLMLVVGFLTRLAALGLGLDMVGAIVTAGIQVGGPIHLVLAPTLAAAMLFLIWAGPGPYSIDARLAQRMVAPI